MSTRETIFDHNPTDEELDGLFACTPDNDPGFYEKYRAAIKGKGSSPETMARLFFFRGDQEKVQHYLDMIKDPQQRFEVEYTMLQTS